MKEPSRKECPVMCVKKRVLEVKHRESPCKACPTSNTPFKRVALDIVGLIHPMSDNGHRYILTLVDYATRYPEAVALKKYKYGDSGRGDVEYL